MVGGEEEGRQKGNKGQPSIKVSKLGHRHLKGEDSTLCPIVLDSDGLKKPMIIQALAESLPSAGPSARYFKCITSFNLHSNP